MTAPDAILSIRNLRKQFGGLSAVDGVTLDFKAGEIHSIIGPNGAGKTTFFNLLTKIHKPTSGEVWFKGQDITNLAPADIARLGIGRSFQISAVFQTLTALENIIVALQARSLGALAFYRSRRALDSLNERAMELLKVVDLENFASAQVATMSYGRKRTLEIATTLALDPVVLLLDEPMSGMGTEDIAHVSEVLRKIAEGRTLIMIEHNLSVVASLSDHITVLANGRIIASGDYATVSRDPHVIEAYIGEGDD